MLKSGFLVSEFLNRIHAALATYDKNRDEIGFMAQQTVAQVVVECWVSYGFCLSP